jgi:hypothetical protein
MKKEEKIGLTEKDKEEIKSIISDSFLFDETTLGNQQNQMKDVETVKVIINELLGVKKHLPSTTNLTTNQVHGITKLKTVNKIFKSSLADEYIYNLEELKRSETKEPLNMLNGLFNIANNSGRFINDEIHGVDRILGRKGKM